MPRNASGVYTLPPSNPVVPNTTIATTWANPTLSDIGNALTESLDRAGRGGMTASFKLFDGSLSAPGLAFLNETNLGLWRSSAGVMELSSGGTTFLSINATSVISPVKMEHRGVDTYKVTGALSWLFANDTGDLVLLPSTSVNGEDWAPAKGMTIQGSTGSVSIGANLAVVGAITAGSWGFNDITAANITSNDKLTVNGIATFNSTVTAKQYAVTAVSSAGVAAINFAISQSQVLTLAASLTITSIAGLALGNIGRLTFKNTNLGLVFPATVKWPGPSFAPPNFAAGSLKEAIVVLEFDGTNFLANASVY